jgi:hypothetical protein
VALVAARSGCHQPFAIPGRPGLRHRLARKGSELEVETDFGDFGLAR